MTIRIGQGFDVHAFCAGEHVHIGGVKIPFHKGLLAHSDGDVLLHALCDAMLGALALGDIGKHFPDTDAQFKNADSRLLLAKVAEKIQAAGYQVVNIDATVLAEKPKIAPHIENMQQTIAGILNIKPNQVSIKATTTEKLGAIGREEGIAALCVCLLQAHQQ